MTLPQSVVVVSGMPISAVGGCRPGPGRADPNRHV